MNGYPEAVEKIVADYLERVKSQLRMVPAREQDEFLREIQSHVYEAYQQTPGDDGVARILAVLRNLGEPAEVVSDRLPGSMVGAGTKRNLPLYIVGGILVALFGIPLGFGGVGVVMGLLLALSGVVIAFYAAAGSVLLAGALFMLLGITRLMLPQFWDKLVTLGYIQMNGPVGDFLDQLTPSGQGLFMILVASAIVAAGLGMLWLGRYLLRGLRFLFSLIFDWMRRAGERMRRRQLQHNRQGRHVSEVSFVK